MISLLLQFLLSAYERFLKNSKAGQKKVEETQKKATISGACIGPSGEIQPSPALGLYGHRVAWPGASRRGGFGGVFRSLRF